MEAPATWKLRSVRVTHAFFRPGWAFGRCVMLHWRVECILCCEKAAVTWLLECSLSIKLHSTMQ
jgi:hypothetical protein